MARQTVLPTLRGMGNVRDRRRRCGWGCCRRTYLVASQARFLRPALVVGRERSHLTRTMTCQAVLPALHGMGNVRDRRCSSHADWMAVEADLVSLEWMVPWEGFDLTGSMARQALFPPCCGMRHGRESRGIANMVARGAGFIGRILVFFGKAFVCAMAAQAVQPACYRVWYRLAFVQPWESVGRSSDEQQRHQREQYEHNS